MSSNLMPVPDPPDPPAAAGPFPVPVDRAGLTIPRIKVTPMDGDQYTVQALNPDMLLYEETAAKHRWTGGVQAAPFRYTTFMAWAASRRTGLIGPDITWDVFKATTAEVVAIAEDPVTPTRPGPDPG